MFVFVGKAEIRIFLKRSKLGPVFRKQKVFDGPEIDSIGVVLSEVMVRGQAVLYKRVFDRISIDAIAVRN